MDLPFGRCYFLQCIIQLNFKLKATRTLTNSTQDSTEPDSARHVLQANEEATYNEPENNTYYLDE